MLSNVVSKGCSKLVSSPANAAVEPNSGKSVVSPGVRPQTSSGDFPRIGAAVQRSRDDDRRRILDNELSSEQRALDEARQAMSEQSLARVDPVKLQSVKDRVALHERNIVALRKEIAGLR